MRSLLNVSLMNKVGFDRTPVSGYARSLQKIRPKGNHLVEAQEEEAIPNLSYEVCSSLSGNFASERKGILEKKKEVSQL